MLDMLQRSGLGTDAREVGVSRQSWVSNSGHPSETPRISQENGTEGLKKALNGARIM